VTHADNSAHSGVVGVLFEGRSTVPDLTHLYWNAGLLLLAAIAIFLGLIVARGLRNRYSDSGATTAFTLQDLRELRASGQISDREYETMRAAIVGSVRRAADPPAPTPTSDSPSAPGDPPESQDPSAESR
jgi:uncharacterized membrane protein